MVARLCRPLGSESSHRAPSPKEEKKKTRKERTDFRLDRLAPVGRLGDAVPVLVRIGLFGLGRLRDADDRFLLALVRQDGLVVLFAVHLLVFELLLQAVVQHLGDRARLAFRGAFRQILAVAAVIPSASIYCVPCVPRGRLVAL